MSTSSYSSDETTRDVVGGVEVFLLAGFNRLGVDLFLLLFDARLQDVFDGLKHLLFLVLVLLVLLFDLVLEEVVALGPRGFLRVAAVRRLLLNARKSLRRRFLLAGSRACEG